jgi:hypothetical protein
MNATLSGAAREVLRACTRPRLARSCWQMDFRRALAGPHTLVGFVRRHLGAIWIWLYLSVRWIKGNYHQGRRTDAFRIGYKTYRRSIQVVQRNRITRKALQEAFEQIPTHFSGMSQSFFLAGSVVRSFLGEKWLDRHVMPSKHKRGFLTIDASSPRRLIFRPIA